LNLIPDTTSLEGGFESDPVQAEENGRDGGGKRSEEPRDGHDERVSA
jgi:hypothetical protein